MQLIKMILLESSETYYEYPLYEMKSTKILKIKNLLLTITKLDQF